MVLENVRLLLRLLWKPADAMSGILDRGSLLFASVAVLAVTLVLQSSLNRAMPPAPVPAAAAVEGGQPPSPPARPWWQFRFYTPLLLLAVVYVPGTLLVTNWIQHLGGFGTVLERDYSTLLTCASMACAAVELPVAVIAPLVPLYALAALAGAAAVYLLVLMFFAVRTVFGTENGTAAGAAGLSIIPMAAGILALEPLRFALSWLASPFFLFYALYFLRGEFGNLGAGLRRRQNFRRMLETAAINPHDADAQYELGLIYQQRRQYTEAIERFRNAVTIDPTETDAQFQLGRIAREQGRLRDAVGYFQTVIAQNEKHSQHEILRELGATYLAAGQYQDARSMLAEYLENRPYDPEGLFYYGRALEGLGDTADARDAYGRAVGAARTAPRYRKRFTAKWSRLAQRQARKLSSS